MQHNSDVAPLRTAIVGGGAAGFFLAICLKERCPQMEVSILEGGTRVLRKVMVSGGGRCNCTNTFSGVSDLQTVYPRGHRLMKRLLRGFGPREAMQWFESRGVPLVVQADGCVFPRSQQAGSIVQLLLSEARRLGIRVVTGCRVTSLDALRDYHFVAVTTGGQPRMEGLAWLQQAVEQPVPSLFSLSVADERLHQLMGTVVERASAMIPGTRLRSQGALLITHWGLSGPCILRLSSYAARTLNEAHYQLPLAINWLDCNEAQAMPLLQRAMCEHPQRLLTTVNPFALQQRLWQYLVERCLGSRSRAPWGSLNAKELNRLCSMLTNDVHAVSGRAAFKDEFVTCGGVSLAAVNPATLESRTRQHLYFAGEVLDIDGITGGFNFQAAWTTAYTVAGAIAERIKTT